MFDFFKNKNKTPRLLGLGIGSSSVKVLELSKAAQQYCVESYAIVPITHTIPHAIEHALVLSGTQLRSAAIAMPDSDVISKIIPMDTTLSSDEMEEMIMADANKYIPYPLDEVSLDFEVLGASEKILLTATRTTQVHARTALANAAGLNVHIVDVQSHALARASSLVLSEYDEMVMIVDIGSNSINVMVLHQNQIIFSRTESFEKPSAILMQIQRALHFFFSSDKSQTITHMLLAGGGSDIPELCAELEKQTNIPCSITNPFTHMSIAPHIDPNALNRDARRLMISCGLALRSFDA